MKKPSFDPQFILNIQTAVLKALLTKDLLTKWQFDLCLEELKKCKG